MALTRAYRQKAQESPVPALITGLFLILTGVVIIATTLWVSAGWDERSWTVWILVASGLVLVVRGSADAWWARSALRT